MDSKAASTHPKFTSIQDELEYWKNLALDSLDFKQKYEQIFDEEPSKNRSIRKRSASPAEDDTAEKKFKNSSMDPFDSDTVQKDVHRYIAQHFSGKELLEMSECSSASSCNKNEKFENEKYENEIQLQLFHVNRLSTKMMEFIALNMLQLQELVFTEVEKGALERYEEMKMQQVEGMNTEIQYRQF